MYLDCTIKIPEVDGKITKKKIKQTIYVYYEYARIYDRDKKYNVPKRTCIGKQVPNQSALMIPNDKFLKIIQKINDNQNPASLRKRILKTGPVLEDAGNLLKIPLVIDDGDSVELSCNATSEKITVTGMVSLTKGYPLSGKYGEEVAGITLCFKDGSEQKVILGNGTDITTVFELYRSSKINPVAENSRKVATFGYDKNFERYVLNSFDIVTDKNVPVEKVLIESKNNGYALLIYGVST